MRIRLSSMDRKKREDPGSPCRPERPRSWVVDAPALVPFGADDVQATGFDHLIVALAPFALDPFNFGFVRLLQFGGFNLPVATEHDVRAPPGHVGGDGHRTGRTGLGHNVRLALMLLGVEHVVGDRALLQLRGQTLR